MCQIRATLLLFLSRYFRSSSRIIFIISENWYCITCLLFLWCFSSWHCVFVPSSFSIFFLVLLLLSSLFLGSIKGGFVDFYTKTFYTYLLTGNRLECYLMFYHVIRLKIILLMNFKGYINSFLCVSRSIFLINIENYRCEVSIGKKSKAKNCTILLFVLSSGVSDSLRPFNDPL